MTRDRKRLFCSKPFEWFEVTQLNGRGGAYLCCPSWLETPVGNLRHQSVDEIWNGETAQAIRQSILDGSFRYCNASRCPYLQTESGPVQPVDRVTDPDLEAAIAEQRTRLPYGPKRVICTYDQSCNLACPTCRTAVIIEHESKDEILAIQRKLEQEALPEAEYLLITGSGDPFGSPFFRRWLQTMRREEMPNLDWIHLHTNALLWTPKTWATIAEEVRRLVRSCEISIDAASAETYAMNRGGDFARLEENLAFIGDLRRRGPLETLKISMVVQENNFREMPAFVRLGQRYGVDCVYFSQLVNWGTFTDEEFRRRAVHRPTHHAHAEFLRVLQSPALRDPVVDLGNLTTLAAPPAGDGGGRLARLTGRLVDNVRTYLHARSGNAG